MRVLTQTPSLTSHSFARSFRPSIRIWRFCRSYSIENKTLLARYLHKRTDGGLNKRYYKTNYILNKIPTSESKVKDKRNFLEEIYLGPAFGVFPAIRSSIISSTSLAARSSCRDLIQTHILTHKKRVKSVFRANGNS